MVKLLAAADDETLGHYTDIVVFLLQNSYDNEFIEVLLGYQREIAHEWFIRRDLVATSGYAPWGAETVIAGH